MTAGYVKMIQKEGEKQLIMLAVETKSPPTLQELQGVVGGLIEPMFTIPSPLGNGRQITGYVNEEGLMIGLPIMGAVHDESGYREFAGNMVVTALDSNGDTLRMVEKEIIFISDCWTPSGDLILSE